ncbi:hypothetical protein RclHR1_16330004 [Rhizophagus clarus]|uniref:NYN domain-containing protein n=1 Tax=Rhizophagus clarus TaxID=94130 RepID=A0A2Z6QLP5_9GLOM|nr:hypothetical protein RclHR1_16330004 [Rhizophagus clarus]
MDSTHASSLTFTRTSPSTSSADLLALSQEISRLSTIFNEQEFTQKNKAELRKFFTVEVTQRKDILDLISTLTNDREKLNYLKEFLTGIFLKLLFIFANNTEYLLILVLFFPASYPQTRPKNTFTLSYIIQLLESLVVAKSPDNSVSIFIDNSNLFIEGAKIVGQLENVPDVYSNSRSDIEFYVDHGLLVTTVLRGRKLRNAFIIGSIPSENDTLWARARDHGCEVTTYERNASNKEKKADVKLVCYAMRTLFTKTGSTILIIAGDGDYCPLVEEAKKENWKVETWFWDGSNLPLFPTGMNAGLKNISSYVSLDDYYKSFTYITGPDFTNNKSILEIHGNVIKSWPFRNKRLMVCFCELNLFGRWYWVDDTTAYLYFESKRQLDSARSWFRRNYPGMLLYDFKQKQMGRRNSFGIQKEKL